MKIEHLTIIVFLCVQGFTAFSQFSLSTDSVYLQSDEMEVNMDPVWIYNETNDPITLVWEKNVHCLSEGWHNPLSDVNLDYTPDLLTYEFTLAGQDSNFMYPSFFTFDTFPGFSVTQLDFYIAGSSEEKQTCTFYWNTTTCTTSLKEYAFQRQLIHLSPNPASETLIIETTVSKYLVELYDLKGVPVLRKELKGNQTIDVSSLIPGMYLAVFKTPKGVIIHTERMIKL